MPQPNPMLISAGPSDKPTCIREWTSTPLIFVNDYQISYYFYFKGLLD